MSVRTPTITEIYALLYPCPVKTCQAPLGMWCKDYGVTSVDLHGDRINPIHDYGRRMYDEGFEMGEAGATEVHDVDED